MACNVHLMTRRKNFLLLIFCFYFCFFVCVAISKRMNKRIFPPKEVILYLPTISVPQTLNVWYLWAALLTKENLKKEKKTSP